MKIPTLEHYGVSFKHTTVGVLALAILAILILRKPKAPPISSTLEPSVQTHSSAAQRLSVALAELEKIPNTDPQATTKILEAVEGLASSPIGQKLPDGREPPELPSKAPQRIRLGVVLIAYRGALLAPNTALDKKEAFERARIIHQNAIHDFQAAVRLGEKGSSPDIGFISRGVLEKGIEYQVFSLAQGEVSDVIDTPRGFWIVKRL